MKDLSRYMTFLRKLFQRFNYNQIVRNVQSCFLKNFKALVLTFLGLLLTFVDDMFDGNMAVYFSRMSQLSLLTCGTETELRPNVLTDFHSQWMELCTDM